MEFIDANRDGGVEGVRLGVEPVVTVLRDAGVAVAPSSHYAHKSRTPSKRSRRDVELTRISVDNYCVYGLTKLHKAALMAGRDRPRPDPPADATSGVAGRDQAKIVKTTRPDPATARHPDLVMRDFTAAGPNSCG